MNRWVVKIEEHPMTFDPSPWVNYQGEMYMGQEGVRYQDILEPDKVDKWGQVVTTQKPEEPPYEETPELKLLNALKVIHIPKDDPNMALYKRETDKTKQCYFARNPPPHSVVKDKVLYVYLRISPTMIVTPMFFDKHAILYEPMDNKEVQDLTSHGMPIPELAPMVTMSSLPRKNVNDKRGLDGLMYDSSKAASSRPGAKSGEKLVPIAWPLPTKNPISTFEHHDGVAAHEVPTFTPHTTRPTERMLNSREEPSAHFLGQSSSEPRKARPSDFQKWFKKFNGTNDPYDHLASF